jgi:hypothetical protein
MKARTDISSMRNPYYSKSCDKTMCSFQSNSSGNFSEEYGVGENPVPTSYELSHGLRRYKSFILYLNYVQECVNKKGINNCYSILIIVIILDIHKQQ